MTAVSVVIPCRNAASLIGQQLAALVSELEGQPAEVVIADNGSTDDLFAVVAEFDPQLAVRVVDASDRLGVNHARNVGVSTAKGELILVCDADDVVQPGWLAAHVRAYEQGCALLAGRVVAFVLQPGDLPTGDGESGAMNPPTLGFLPYAIGANCGFRRSIWEQIGGFDETFIGGADEIDFFWRAQLAGHHLCAVAEARVWYRQRRQRRARMRQARMAALGRARLYRKHRSSGWRRRPAVVGYSRRLGRLIVDLPGALRGGESLTEWLVKAAALAGHVEALWRVRAACP